MARWFLRIDTKYASGSVLGKVVSCHPTPIGAGATQERERSRHIHNVEVRACGARITLGELVSKFEVEELSAVEWQAFLASQKAKELGYSMPQVKPAPPRLKLGNGGRVRAHLMSKGLVRG